MKIILFITLLSKFALAFKINQKYVTYSLQSIEGNFVKEKDPQQLKILASTTKLLSLYFANKILKADYRFETSFWYTGEIKNNTLTGDLYLVGSGDPFVTAEHLMNFVHQLKALGVHKVNGQFYLDEATIPKKQSVSSLGLEDQADNSSLGAFNTEFNRINLIYKGMSAVPHLNHLLVKRQSKLKSPGLKYQFIGDEKNEHWLKKTRAKKIGLRYQLPIKNPSVFVAKYLSYLATLENIELPLPKFAYQPDSAVLIHRHYSKPLLELTKLAFEFSNNIMAEMPSLMAARELSQKKLDFDSGVKVLNQWLIKNTGITSLGKNPFENASGLTIQNMLSAKDLTSFLVKIEKENLEGRSFQTLLPIAGHSGFLSKRLMDPKYAFKVWAKTGSLYFVSNIAGYLYGRSGKKYAFSILITDEKRRNILNQKDSTKVDRIRQQESSWQKRARAYQDQLMRKWIDTL